MERAETHTKCGPTLSNALRRGPVICRYRGNALRWIWRALSPPIKTPIIFKCSWNLVTKETLLNYWKISFGVSSFGRSVFFLFRNAIWHGQVVILWHEQTSLPWPLRTVIPRVFLQKRNQEIQFCAGDVLPTWWNTATSPEKQSFKIFLLITHEFHTLNFGHLQPPSLHLFQIDHLFHTQPTLCPHFLFKNHFS